MGAGRAAEDESQFPQVTNPRQRAFLAAFRESGNVLLACKAASVGRSSHYRWLAESPPYRETFEVAREEAADRLEAEIDRRALEGVWRPTGWHKGEPGAYVREYSDLLLIFRAKGLMPDKYKDHVEFRGALAQIDVTRLQDDQLARIVAGEHPLAVLSSSAPGLAGQQALPVGTLVAADGEGRASVNKEAKKRGAGSNGEQESKQAERVDQPTNRP